MLFSSSMRLALPLLLVAFLACGGDDDGGSSVASGNTVTTGAQCAADTRKDVYAPGLTKPAGAFSVKLVSTDPAAPTNQNNTFDFAVTDAAGAPLDGATITVTPWMPDHAHGSAVRPTVTATGGGNYVAKNVYLAMAGLWRITVTVESAGTRQDAVFQFCLDG